MSEKSPMQAGAPQRDADGYPIERGIPLPVHLGKLPHADAPTPPNARHTEPEEPRWCDYRRPDCINDGVQIGKQWVCRHHFSAWELVAPHTLAALNQELTKALAELEDERICTTCGGSPPASGLPCVCGGTGSRLQETHGLRRALHEAQADHDRLREQYLKLCERRTSLQALYEASQAEVASLRKDLQDQILYTSLQAEELARRGPKAESPTTPAFDTILSVSNTLEARIAAFVARVRKAYDTALPPQEGHSGCAFHLSKCYCGAPTFQQPCPLCDYYPMYGDTGTNWAPDSFPEHYFVGIVDSYGGIAPWYFANYRKTVAYRDDLQFRAAIEGLVGEAKTWTDVPTPAEVWDHFHPETAQASNP